MITPRCEGATFSGKGMYKEIGPILLDPSLLLQVNSFLVAQRCSFIIGVSQFINSHDDMEKGFSECYLEIDGRTNYPIPRCHIMLSNMENSNIINQEFDIPLTASCPSASVIPGTTANFSLQINDHVRIELSALSSMQRDLILYTMKQF